MDAIDVIRDSPDLSIGGVTIPREYVEEHARCAKDEWHWMTKYVKVEDKNRGLILNFEPWEHLFELLTLYHGEKRIIILKARQVGVSWFWAAIALHIALFVPNSSILMLSKTEDDAISFKSKAMFIYRHLPEWMKQPTGKDNDSTTTFPIMESQIRSFPATEGSGRGETATLVLLDEWAFHPYAETNMTAILPTVENATIVGISTANGRGGTGKYYYETWTKAEAGNSNFKPIFLSYDVVPGRDEDFLFAVSKDMAAYKVKGEYPRSAEEAFILSGTCMFDLERLGVMPITDVFSILMGICEIYKNPVPNHDYVAGIDTALGIAGGDYSVCQIVDVLTGEVVAKVRGRIPIEEFGPLVYQLLKSYGHPFVIVEMQFQGSIVIKALKDGNTEDTGYPVHKIYHRSKNNAGWHTNESNRNNILAELESGIRTGVCVFYSDNTLTELLSFGYNDDNGKFEALSGHDDEVMSLALAWHARCNFQEPMTDFTAHSYDGYDDTLTGFVQLTDIQWSKKNPLKGLVQITCPECQGSRINRFDDGDVEPCDLCDGMGAILKRGEPDARPVHDDASEFLEMLEAGLAGKRGNVGRGAARV